MQRSMKPPTPTAVYSTAQRQRYEPFVRPPDLLIIDQEVLFTSLLKRSLEALGYETSIASSGEAALYHLDLTNVDLILLDPTLADMDGYLLCAEIHKRYDKPIIVTSEFNDIDKALRAFSAGASAIVYKPFRLQELAAEIHKTLQIATTRKAGHYLPLPEEAHAIHSV